MDRVAPPKVYITSIAEIYEFALADREEPNGAQQECEWRMGGVGSMADKEHQLLARLHA